MYLPFLSCECNFNSNFFLLECETVLSSHHVVYIGFDWWVRVVFALPEYPWGGFFSTSKLETVKQPWRWNYTILLYRESLFYIVENCGRALKMNLYNTSFSGKPISKSETVWEPRRCNYTTLLNRLPCQLRWGRRRRHCSAIVWHTFFHALHLETRPRPPIFKMIKLKKLRHAEY